MVKDFISGIFGRKQQINEIPAIQEHIKELPRLEDVVGHDESFEEHTLVEKKFQKASRIRSKKSRKKLSQNTKSKKEMKHKKTIIKKSQNKDQKKGKNQRMKVSKPKDSLLSKLNSYWNEKKKEKSPSRAANYKNSERIDDVKRLEEKWRLQKIGLDRQLKELKKTEIDVEQKMQEMSILSGIGAANPDQYFFAKNGGVFKSIKELQSGLASMDNDTFSYHANSSKNDFAKWIDGVFKNHYLARRIYNCGTKEEMIEALRQFI